MWNDVDVSYCDLTELHLTIQSEPSSHNVVENSKITIHNSSFRTLDLQPGTEALITDCYMNKELSSRHTLITASTCKITVQDCFFGNFANKNGPTIIYVHSSSTVVIQASNFHENHGFQCYITAM